MKTYWGDLHNHCAISYGSSTLKRALNNARAHLDFCSITGHAFWPDMPMDLKSQDSIIGMHLGGFEKLRYFWSGAMQEMKGAQEPNRFVVLPSYEWHSMHYGDYNCYFPGFDIPLLGAETLPKLAATLEKQKSAFFMLPHHCGYAPGFRGTRWKAFDETVSPLAEIYSNHGCCESDDAPYDYYHSMGPRAGISTIRQGLMLGKRFGFYASTDSHDGYPGHYGHGITGVQAEELTTKGVWNALRARRTVASTGARILMDYRIGDTGLGGVHRYSDNRQTLALNVRAVAPIVRAELIEGNRKGWSVRPLPFAGTQSTFAPGRYKVKIEAGWGRGAQSSQWEVDIRILNGTLRTAAPCFRHSAHPLAEEEGTESLSVEAKNRVLWKCRATPNPSGLMGGTHFNASGTQAIVLEIEAQKSTAIKIRTAAGEMRASLPELINASVVQPSGSFGSSALKIHRASPEREWTLRYEEPFVPTARRGFCYARITQSDGHVAWSSPIWWE